MNTNYALDNYRSHELNISMKTSSGDLITMDFSNETSTSIRQMQSDNGSQNFMKFSSMQAFSFSMRGNGLDTQDQKEIDAFMEIAQPYIDNFLEGLGSDSQNSPVGKVARDIASVFEPSKEREPAEKESVKANIVKLFDKALSEFEAPKQLSPQEMIEKIFNESQKLLEKTLEEFDTFNKMLYA
ncbi:MAG: hypothetical protein JXQ67_10345 [Campylobacterales bacterium]|nr:hypothetical protein [Campylobacterales bacterium]